MLYNELCYELKRMVDRGQWTSHSRKTNGKLRICFDPRPLNQVTKREHLHLPTAAELFLKYWEQSTF